MDMVSLTFIHLRLPLISIRSGFCIYVLSFFIIVLTQNTASSVVTVERTIGFRHLELVQVRSIVGVFCISMCVFQEPLPDKEEGLSFYFRINGITYFTKLKMQ